MKKILGTAIGVVVVYGAAAISLGFLAEKSMHQQVEHFNQTTGAMNGLKLSVKNYSRGLFFSSMDVQVGVNLPSLSTSEVGIISHTKIQHGPVLTLGGFGFGSYATESTLGFNLGDEEANKEFKELFGESIGLITAHYGFNKSYNGKWALDAINYSKDGTDFSIADSEVEFSGSLESKKLQTQIHLGAVKIKNLTSDIQMEPFIGQSDQYEVAENVPIANMELATAKISVTAPDLPMPIVLENFKLEQKQSEDNKQVDTRISITLDKLTGPVEVKNAYYLIEFNNLPIDGLQALYKAIPGMNTAADPFAAQQMLLESLPKLMTDGVELKLGLGSDYLDGNAKADFGLVYHAPTDGSSLLEQAPDQLIKLFSANLDVLVSESIANTMPMGEQLPALVGTYLILENGVYKLNAKLKDTQLTIGTQVMPAEQYMPLLMMGAMGMAAQGEQPAEESPMDESTTEENMDENDMPDDEGDSNEETTE